MLWLLATSFKMNVEQMRPMLRKTINQVLEGKPLEAMSKKKVRRQVEEALGLEEATLDAPDAKALMVLPTCVLPCRDNRRRVCVFVFLLPPEPISGGIHRELCFGRYQRSVLKVPNSFSIAQVGEKRKLAATAADAPTETAPAKKKAKISGNKSTAPVASTTTTTTTTGSATVPVNATVNYVDVGVDAMGCSGVTVLSCV